MKKENVFIGGAVVAAIGSSLCCVLPLLAALFGLGAFGAASAFEQFRPYLLATAVLALAFSFYRVYFRRENCDESESCATKPVSRINQIFLWAATFVIFAFAVSPYYTGYLAAALSNPPPTSSEAMPAASSEESLANKTVVIGVEGMTCGGCEAHIEETLKKLPGVVSADASYENKNVTVIYNPKQVALDRIKQAINSTGYKAK